MTKQCVNEEVIKDIFVMTCHEFPNHSISIISDDWHIWWDVVVLQPEYYYFNDFPLQWLWHPVTHNIQIYIYVYMWQRDASVCHCVAASTIISITFYYNDIYIYVTQYTYIIQLYIVYVVVFQPKYEQVPNQSTEPSRTDEVTVSLVGSICIFWLYLSLEVSLVGSMFRIFSWKFVFFGSMWSVHKTSFTAKTKGWWGLWPTGQLAEQLRPWHLKRCRQCSVEEVYF